MPHIMTSHGVLTRNDFEKTRGRLKKKALEILFSRIDIIQSVSRDAQENLVSHMPFLKGTHLVTIRSGVHVQSLTGDPGPSADHTLTLPLGQRSWWAYSR